MPSRLMNPVWIFVAMILPRAATAQPADDNPKGCWSVVSIPRSEDCFALTFDPHDERRALLGSRPGSLWETLDAGQTWSQKTTAISSTRSHGVNRGGIAVHPRVRGLWYFGHEKFGAFRSRDNGESWVQISEGLVRNNERHGVCFTFDLADDATIFYGSDEGIFRSKDSGDHWVKCTSGLPTGFSDGKQGNTTVNRLLTHPGTGAIYAGFYAVGEFEMPGIYRSLDHGDNWELINGDFDGGVDQEASKELVNRLIEIQKDKASESLKANYERVQRGEPLRTGLMKGWIFDLRLEDSNDNVLVAATTSKLIVSSNAGKNWQACDTVRGPRSVAIHPSNSDVMVASGTNQIWITRDGGKSWSDCSSNYGAENNGVAKVRPFTRFLTFDPSGQRVYALTQSGTWVAMTADLQ